MAESNLEMARRGFEAALRGDLDAIGELLDPDVRWHGGNPSAAGACRNRAEALAFMRQSEIIRGGRFELVDLIAVGDKVVIIMRPASEGDQPAPAVANVATFRERKVIEMVHYATAGDALAAAGVDRDR
jgi:ketosteroid isomerase-like protein